MKRIVKVFLITLGSLVAIITALSIWFFISMSKGTEISPDNLAFKTREDIVLLTGIQCLPAIELKTCWRDPLEGTVIAKFEYSEEPSREFLSEIEKRCADENDLFWSANDNSVSGYDFERGWDADFMEKPSETFPDYVSVNIHFSDNGLTVNYDYQPFVFKGFCTQEELMESTGVHFPPFEIVNYRWHPVGPDAAAHMTIRLQGKPGKAFIKEIKEKWREEDPGEYVWRDGDYTENGAPMKEYTIRVKENSPLVTFNYATY